jgi:hypothetical protein
MAPPGRRGEWQLLALRVRSIVFTAQFFHSRTDRPGGVKDSVQSSADDHQGLR